MNREPFASIDEAFTMSDEMAQHMKQTKKPKNKSKVKVPSAFGSSNPLDPVKPMQEERPAPSSGPVGGGAGPSTTIEGFALPGDSASDEEWTKAFTLAPSSTAFSPFSSFGSVDGAPSSWRKIPAPVQAPSTLITSNSAPPISNSLTLPYDIQKRFDQLTQQLEGITASTPMQNTAEIFLFIAIGLLFILAVDTLLRFTTQIAMHTLSKRGKWFGGSRRFH